MTPFTLPADGVVLVRSPHDDPSTVSTKGPTQIMRLNLAQHTTDRILNTLRNDEQVKLCFGKRVALKYGKTTHQIQANQENHTAELYFGASDKKEQLYFSGKSSHTLEVRKAQKATEQSDEALANLQNTLKSMQEQKTSNEASFITNKEDLRQLTGNKKGHRPSPLLSSKAQPFRKDHLLAGITHSTPSSPFLNASFSPGLGPTSAPLLSSSAPSKDKLRLDAIKIPLLHLLAVRPMTFKNLAQTLRATREDCDKILDKVAKDCSEAMGKKQLKEKSYKELDVWKFPYPSQVDRQAAIDRAIHAFDRMRVGRNEILWQLLLPEERRGKGECLSKLNFDQPVPTIRTPRLVAESSVSGTKGEPGNENDTDTERGRHSTKAGLTEGRAVSQNPVHNKRVSEKEAISKQHMRKDSKELPKEPKKRIPLPSKNKPRADTKYKSADKIVDSDEEIEGATAAPTKALTTDKDKSATTLTVFERPEARKGPLSPKKRSHESRSSQSSNSDTNILSIRKEQSLKPISQSKGDSASSKLSPRPRKGSSPHKPSPLASSPPANANDPDTSISSKSSASSTAASSPPSSSDLRKQKPPATNHSRQDVPSMAPKTSTKRKADTIEDTSVNKRQQVNGRFLWQPKHDSGSRTQPSQAEKTQKTPKQDAEAEAAQLPEGVAPPPAPPPEDLPHRKSTDSEADAISPSEKDRLARIALIEKSKTYNVYYAKYKALHEKVVEQDAKDDEAYHQLLKMRKRIEDLAQENWDEWVRLGEPDEKVFEADAAGTSAA